jgi:hypothetical protein
LNNLGNLGYWSGLAASTFAVAFGRSQLLQLLGVLRFPVDEYLIFGTSQCIVLPLLLELLALHHLTSPSKQIWTHASLMLTVIYAVFVTAHYVVQLATVIPAKLQGQLESVRVLKQSQHSLFWDLDAVGYIAMGLACLFAVPAVTGTGFDRWVKRALIAHASVPPLVGIVHCYPTFSSTLLLLALPWVFTAPVFMVMIAVKLRRTAKQCSQAVVTASLEQGLI